MMKALDIVKPANGKPFVGYMISCNVYRRGIKAGVDKVTAELYYNKTIDIDTVNHYCCDEFIDSCAKKQNG